MSVKQIIYISIEDVLTIHDDVLRIYWWLAWVKDKQQIESVLQHIQNNEYYPTLLEKSTHLFFWLIKFHSFNDGNKRTAISILSIFFMIHDINIPSLVTKLEDIAVWVASNNISKDELQKYLEILLNSFGYNKNYLKNFN